MLRGRFVRNTALFICKAGIPRRRHGHQHQLAQHGFNFTSDTRYFLAIEDPREDVRDSVGVGVGVGVMECQLNTTWRYLAIFRFRPAATVISVPQ